MSDTPEPVKVLDDHDIWDVSEISRTITPAEATELLKLNTHNRSIRRGTIDRLRADIAGGRFLLNGDTIAISTDGVLLNGQHRLEAIAAGKTPVEVIILKGVDPKAFSTIDGHRPRSLSDYMNVHGAPNYARIATLTPRAERWDGGQRGRDMAAGTKRHGEQVYIDFYEDNAERLHAALRSPSQYDNITPAITSLFRYIIGGERAVECDVYLREVSSGQAAERGGTVTANTQKVFTALVRESVNNDASKSHRVLGILITGWNARQKGKCVKKDPFDGGPVPEPVDA